MNPGTPAAGDPAHARHGCPGMHACAEIRHELTDQFWGERHGQLTDPFGHRWNIAQHLQDIPADEIAAAAARMFGPS